LKSELPGRAAVAHGGGPTAVLNASLAGVISECRKHPAITGLYGSRFGVAGLFEGDFIDLFAGGAESIEAIRGAPGSAIGSSRTAIEDPDCGRILDVLRRRDVRYLLLTGGNGSMETALRIHQAAQASGYGMHVIGVPKTIDNDIVETDHTPGYGSCARFFAHAARDIGADNRALPPPVEILEVLGRDTGWVVAATALARHREDDPPNLIYFPERGIGADRICADVKGVYRRLGRCMITVCEGQKDDRGGWFGADIDTRPGSRNRLPANLGQVLAQMIASRTGLRARAEKPGLFGRSCAALVSEVDRDESWRCGEAAVRAALEGRSGEMVAIRRIEGVGYASEMAMTALHSVAGRTRRFPEEWMESADVAPAFLEWARPIAGEVQAHGRL
jgi:ATP-dependent phosphofructokinase / diphosphate-dependent phosphofructokinase